MKLTAINLAVLLAFLVGAAAQGHAMCGLVMKDGKVMMMKDGIPTQPMAKDMAMPDGKKVTTNGTVKMKDGSTKHLDDGDMMLMNGHLMKRGGKPAPMQKRD